MRTEETQLSKYPIVKQFGYSIDVNDLDAPFGASADHQIALSLHASQAGQEVGIVVPAMCRSRGAAHDRDRVVLR